MNPEDIVRYALRAQAGEQEAVEKLAQTCHPIVYRLAISILDDPHEAQDAAQEALIRMLRALNSLQQAASFRTWLYAITLNVCRGRLRKRQRNQKLLATLDALVRLMSQTSSSPEEHVLLAERKTKLVRVVDVLPEEQRTALILRYYHELSVAEIARLMGVVERTVYVWLRKAIEQLQEDMEEDED